MFEKNKLSLCVALVLGLSASMPLIAQEGSDENKKESSEQQQDAKSAKAKKKSRTVISGDDDLVVQPGAAIETIQVTGSLIPRNSFDGPDPMTVITDEDMKARGLNTIAEVIDSLSENTGYREGKSGNLLSGYTVGASEANLRGLGTGRTLVLVNGRRIADYPLPFGGEQNGTDMGVIPGSAVSRTEVLSGSASAIYGSDAVGGVINMITKRDMEQTAISHVTGVYEDGYGMANLTSFITGKAFERGSVTFSMEQLTTEPVYGDEVSYLDNRKFLATGLSIAEVDLANGTTNALSPSGYDCAENGMYASETYSEDGHTVCNYDGSPGVAMQQEHDRTSMFVDGRYQFTDTTSGFVTVLATKQDAASSIPANSWRGVVYNEDFSKYAVIGRSFAHDLGYTESSYDQEMWTVMMGVEGELDLGGNVWNWDVGYSKARYNVVQKYGALREDVLNDWLFDGSGGYAELASGVYQVDSDFFDNGLVNNIYRDASVDEESLMGQATTFASSASENVSFKVVGELSDFGVLYNPVTMAVVVDWASQETNIDPDERSRDQSGHGWLNIGATSAHGSRDRKAFGAEFLIPVFEDLNVTLATRLDRYDDSSAIGGRNTSSVKFDYRLFDEIKLRGHYAQTFRAPDMFNIYGESTGFTTITDLSNGNCYDGENFTGTCSSYTVNYTRRGIDDLEEEKGNDVGFGIVFTPTNNVSVSADWYKVRLEDLVLTESAYSVMDYEWQCANGAIPGGSQFCQNIRDRVIRDASGRVTSIIVEPQNHEYREVEGLDIRASARFESKQYGNFGVGMVYVNTLSHEWLQFAGDEPIDMRTGLLGQSVPATRTNLSLSWNNPLNGFRSVGAGLFIRRQGRVDNYVGTKQLEPFYTANLTARYQHTARLGVSLGIQNLTNAMPISDETSPRWPYYWSHLQSPMGRSYNLSFSYFLSD
ncbi:TonB-dependent receptor [Microbulbifer bruguierae]|uniref:TonB-dependent receptor n=1 Tax=Microbulbifer bruguierae TaxID=3029061 RepID=A0ABY8NB72_9GAMM|nr:TonB-dependent receptor [Microbulbifer bruguierae]WGL16181.1 TonB-dependent receptor [Microbulbifer bruguierae]